MLGDGWLMMGAGAGIVLGKLGRPAMLALEIVAGIKLDFALGARATIWRMVGYRGGDTDW